MQKSDLDLYQNIVVSDNGAESIDHTVSSRPKTAAVAQLRTPHVCQICQSLLRIDPSITTHLSEATYRQLSSPFASRIDDIEATLVSVASHVDADMKLSLACSDEDD